MTRNWNPVPSRSEYLEAFLKCSLGCLLSNASRPRPRRLGPPSPDFRNICETRSAKCRMSEGFSQFQGQARISQRRTKCISVPRNRISYERKNRKKFPRNFPDSCAAQDSRNATKYFVPSKSSKFSHCAGFRPQGFRAMLKSAHRDGEVHRGHGDFCLHPEMLLLLSYAKSGMIDRVFKEISKEYSRDYVASNDISNAL